MQKARVSIEVVEGQENKKILEGKYAPFDHDNVLRQWKKFNKRMIMYLHTDGNFPLVERLHYTNITNSWFIASECFGINRYEVTILFASIAVEATLNHDERMYSYRLSLPNRWITLSVPALEIAKGVGIDVSDLFERKGKRYVSKFVDMRNKIAHGDIPGYVSILQKHLNKTKGFDILETSGITEGQALEQLKKSFNFIHKWAKTNPIVILGEGERIIFPKLKKKKQK